MASTTVQKRMSARRHRRPSGAPLRSRSLTPLLKSPSSTPASRSARRARFQRHRSKLARSASPSDVPKETQQERSARWTAAAQETHRIVTGDGRYVERRTMSVPEPAAAPGATVYSFVHPPLANPTAYDVIHDVGAQIAYSRQGTTFYPHYSEVLAAWNKSAQPPPGTMKTTIEFNKCSSLAAAHRLIDPTSPMASPSLSPVGASSHHTRVGVMSFASPKKPGNSYLVGSDEQEARLARSTSLVDSFESDAASSFYREHRQQNDGSGLHDHSLLYSPGVVVIRNADDETPAGVLAAPYKIDVLSVVPVNAAAVRARHAIAPAEAHEFAAGIRSAMRERMARALHAFRSRGVSRLVLGAFGAGSSQVPPADVARVWAELLVCGDTMDPQAPFKDVFENIVFAVPGKTMDAFKEAFEMRLFEAEVEREMAL